MNQRVLLCLVLVWGLALGGCGSEDELVPPPQSGSDAFNPSGEVSVTGTAADDSCQSRCGQVAPSGCGCDNACFERKDCCADKEPLCGAYQPPVSEDPSDSCKGFCGHAAPGGCSCQDGCEPLGTCCHDKSDFCGEVIAPEEPTKATCDGFCGKKTPSGCWCNNDCHENDSCCPDKVHFCGEFKPPVVEPASSCENKCGQKADSGCGCNNECHDNGDCCDDKVLFCGEFKPPVAEESASCEGICAQQTVSGCWCGNDCHDNGNCCDDKVLFCGEFVPPVLDQCNGFCGEKSPAGCWCNNECHANDNCCEDKVQFCGAFEPPDQPDQDSCLGICGQQAPGGCWCNNDCHEAGNCCGDKELHCGAFEPPVEPNSSCAGICGGVAESGCACNDACHAAGNCCSDKTTACGPAPDSCVDRCGEEAPAGCSCADGCETEATCCPDKTEACGSPPKEVAGSCDGVCGEQTPQGCWCDDLCELNEDCCADKAEKCGEGTTPGEGSCVGICGQQAPEGCWCDATCLFNDDCCDDAEAECDLNGPEPDTATCAGICGQQAASGCWCNDSCEENGTCCQDKAAECGETTCAKLGHTEGACFGLINGSKCGASGAYACTDLALVGLTCWVLTEPCSPTELCSDPIGPTGAHCEADPDNAANSCANLCGQQAPGGCWCDTLCEQSGDCCPDKSEKCGETTCEDLGHALGSCGVFSGSKCEANDPYNCQTVGLLSCWVKSDVCSESELCVDPVFGGAQCDADPDNALNSCVDNCGGQAPSGCWCDVECDQNDNCCPDKVGACGENTCEELGHELGSCGLLSGSKCEGDQPYACQEKGSLDCWVQTDVCGDGEICNDPFIGGALCEVDPDNTLNSCEGACDGQAPGGCWCDDQCEVNEDCCPDKDDQCGGASCESLGLPGGSCNFLSNNTKCLESDVYSCLDQGPFSCWVLTNDCTEGFKCTDPLLGDAKCVVDDGSPVNSCAGKCGAQASGGCWCDAKCEQNNDCCADKEEACGGTTCEALGVAGGACGLLSGDKCEDGSPWNCVDQGPVSCWVQIATCAANEVCVDPLLSEAHCIEDDDDPANSCVGVCGQQAPGGCWCDDKCAENGDCCNDKDDECGAATCESLGHALGSCGFFSGSKCEDNQPYDCTEIGDLDCWVQTAVCEDGQECEDPFGTAGAQCKGEAEPGPDSCVGFCGDQAPGGCWCDDLCAESEDCCADKDTACPPE